LVHDEAVHVEPRGELRGIGDSDFDKDEILLIGEVVILQDLLSESIPSDQLDLMTAQRIAASVGASLENLAAIQRHLKRAAAPPCMLLIAAAAQTNLGLAGVVGQRERS
jgi:hypothetical protein